MSALVAQLLGPLTLFLAALLMISAIHKILQPQRARRAAAALTRLPATPARVAVEFAVVIEILCFALLCWPPTHRAGAALGAAVFVTYGAFLASALRGERTVRDCGCSFGAREHVLNGGHLARNAVLAALAFLVLGAGAVPAPVAAWHVLAASALLGLYIAADELLGLPPLRRGVLA